MASPTVLTFDAKGRAVGFDVWVDDLQLFLQCDSRDGVSLFDHTSGVSTAPAATADSTVRSQWTTHDAVARLAVRSHLLPAERAHFGQYKTAQSSYDAVIARYSSPSTTALTRLMLPYLSLTLPSKVVEGAAGGVVAEEEGVAVVVGVAPVVGASVAAVEVVEAAAEVEEAAAAVVEVAAAVVLVKVQPRSVEVLVVASVSSSRAPVRPRRFSSLVSGTLGVGGLGVQVPTRTFFALALVVGRCFPDSVELPRWHDLLLQNVPIFGVDFDAILAAMYALADVTEGDCYLSVPPDLGTAAAALGASAAAALGASASTAPGAGMSTPSGTAPTESLHTFTLDSGASHSFFRDSTTLTPLGRPVAVSLADPSGGPVLARSSTVLPSSLASAPCLSRPLSHETLLWHHRLGHPSLPRLRGMASRALVSGLPRSLPPLPSGPAPTCVPCVEGRQRAAPHSSSFPPTEAPLQTLHMDVWGPAHVRGQGHERYFLLVVDDYSRYTTVFPLRSEGEVPEVLIDWIRGARRQLSESFGSDLPVLRLHSDRGGEFSSDLLRAFCRSEGIRQTFTLPASPHQNGIAERHIGMVMDDARTSMIHAAAPHFLWPFAVQYAAHQINLQPRVSLPETTPTLRWTGKVGDASAFRVWRSRAFVRDTTADKLSSLAVPCVFLGFPPDAPGWQFYHPTSRRVLSSQDVTFDESGPAPSGVSQVDPAEPVEVAVDSGAAGAGAAGVAAGASGGAAGAGGYCWGFWRVKRPPGSPPVFKARYVARGLSQRQGVDFFHTFSPTPNMTTLRVLLHIVAQRDYELHSLDFSTAFLQGSLHEEIWLRITRDRAQHTITLTQSHMVQQVLQRFSFTYSSPQSTPLPTGHSLSAPPSDESVELSGPYPELVGCLMYLMTCTRLGLAYPLSILARYVAPDRHRKEHMDAAKRVLRYLCSTSGMGLVLGGRARVRSSQGYTFSLGSGSVSCRSTRSSSVFSSSCEAEIYAGAMAAQELRWLTYLLTDLGEAPRSPPMLYVDNKAMIALCQVHRLEHIALRYFLARELQQRGQLRLAYVATRANTADVFTKALHPCDHQRFCTVLGLVPTLPQLLTS
ncbi:unnamed protein product [Closterium sp. NIES-54]